MKLPFERLLGFVVWYISPKFPIVIQNCDLSEIIDESMALKPLESLELKMAIFRGLGDSKEIVKLTLIVSDEIKKKIKSDGWPYTYDFERSESKMAFKAYTSAFVYLNNSILAEESKSTIDGHVQYAFYRKKIFGKKLILSFSQSIIRRVVGPSGEYFIGLDGGDYLYFGQGKIIIIYSDEVREIGSNPSYYELMSATYNKR